MRHFVRFGCCVERARREHLFVCAALVAPDEALGAHSALCVLCAAKVSSDGSKRIERSSAPRRVSARIDEYEMVLYEPLMQLAYMHI